MKSFSLNYKIVSGVLLLGLIGMFFLWRPWEGRFPEHARTVEVTGDAKLTATPDEYIFRPSYEFKNNDKQMALADLTKKSSDIVAKLKALGVPDNKIKTNSSGYNYPTYEGNSSIPTYTLSLTITVTDKDLAQKVQDYLLTTSPSGAVSPQAEFSDTKRKKLEDQARNDATKEARTKAEQSARNLGFELGPVKSVTDGSGFGTIMPEGTASDSTKSTTPSLQLGLQPGENDLSYNVKVVYYMR